MIVKSEDLTNEKGEVICDEFYYAITKSEAEVNEWLRGLKLVYTLDDKDNLDFEYAASYMDDEQEDMVELIVRILSKINPNFELNNIYVNYNKNSDGSKNLIKIACVSFILPNKEFLVCKAPYYAFNKKAWEYLDELRKEDK